MVPPGIRESFRGLAVLCHAKHTTNTGRSPNVDGRWVLDGLREGRSFRGMKMAEHEFEGRADGIKVFISMRESCCAECGEDLGRHAWITLREGTGAMCLSCADLEHLEFLPSGSAALTRRAKKNSRLWAVVLKWSRARKRYERQGLLVEQEALERAEQECLADEEIRSRRREREAFRRMELDQEYVDRFARRITELYPRCPDGTGRRIAEHACLKYSGRVGRSAAAKQLDEQASRLAVIAHIRHTRSVYDELLMRGCERQDARSQVSDTIDSVLGEWSEPVDT